MTGTRSAHPSLTFGAAPSTRCRATSSARSSKAEQPTDNRPTLVQFQAGGPFGGLILEARGRGANACGGRRPLRGGTSTLRQPSLRRSYGAASHCLYMCGSAAARPGRRRRSPQGRARRARVNHAPAAIFILCKHRERCSGPVNRTGRRKPGAEIHFVRRAARFAGTRAPHPFRGFAISALARSVAKKNTHQRWLRPGPA